MCDAVSEAVLGDDAEALSRLLTSASLCYDALRASAILGAASCARVCLDACEAECSGKCLAVCAAG